MAFADWATIQAAARRVDLAYGEYVKEPSVGASREVRWCSSIKQDGTDGTKSTPSTSVALSYSTHPEWSIEHPTAASGTVHVVGCHVGQKTGFYYDGLLIDRLVHQGGLVANIDTLQTTNLPTSALPTRATGGAGVWMAIQQYSSVGFSDAVITTKYTNQAGTANRTSTHYFYDTYLVNGLNILQLQDGDTGVRSVESIQLDVSTGGAGSWGIVLFKPLALITSRLRASPRAEVDTIVGWGDGIDDEAVLEVLSNGGDGVNQFAHWHLKFAEA